jgi:hypothetical protein
MANTNLAATAQNHFISWAYFCWGELMPPCPAPGARKGPCKGYVIDHIKPLAFGGAYGPSNMQWQTKAEAMTKDKRERSACGK